MAKILIVSHSPYASTGYGRVVRGLAGSLKAAGNQIVCLGSVARPSSTPLPYTVIPWEKLSSPAIAEAIKSHKVQVLLTVGDPWMFEGVPMMPERQSVVWLAYYPVDGYPLPDHWKRWAAAVDVPVVFSKFAREVVQAATGKPPELIYHGVNTKNFFPGDRQKAKELAHVAGHFVVGTVARNQMRKNIPALVKAFAKFAKGKDDALLYLHTQLKGEFDIAELVRNHGIEEKTRITGEIGPDKGVADHLLATVYRAMDVFVLPTMAEGFGLPIMESQACGTPALVTDFSACPELVPDPIQRLKVNETLTMHRNFEQAIVDVDDIVEKLELLYRDRDRLKALGERCHQFAQTFEWDVAYRQFNDLLASERFQSLLAAKAKNSEVATKPAKNAGPFSQRRIDPTRQTQNGNGATSHAAAAVAETNTAGGRAGQFDEVDQLHADAVEKMKAGAIGEAVSLLRRMVDLRPRNPDFQNQLAVVLQAAGKLEEAIKGYRRSLELRPDRPEVWTNLALAYLKSDDNAAAGEACDKALKLAPRSAGAHDILGAIFLKEGRTDQARRVFKHALSLAPGLKSTLAHLAEMGEPVASADLTEDTALQKLDEVVASVTSLPEGFAGRGIVIVGGGLRYFPCAWVCIRILRECGCSLPVELWYLGQEEMTPEMGELVARYDVVCMDGREKAKQEGFANLGGWELKPYAIMHSRFREVLLLDADNFPVVDPEFLFETPEYLATGAIFWPDYKPLHASDVLWQLTGVPYKHEPSFESGQLLIDKSRCWEALTVAMWFNRYSKFWYQYFLGDKDTFHLAWRKLGLAYAMPEEEPVQLPYAMGHRDFAGRRIFQHRNRAKWVLGGWNPRMEEFEKEDRGFAFLEELKQLWHPEPPKYNLAALARLQQAWKQYAVTQKEPEGLLSAVVGNAVAWMWIGRMVKHSTHNIEDSHTIRVLQAAIVALPQLAELYAVLGTTLGTLGRHTDALALFKQAEDHWAELPGLKANKELAGQFAIATANLPADGARNR